MASKLTTRLVMEALEKKSISAHVSRGDNGEPYLHTTYAGQNYVIDLVDGGVSYYGTDSLHASDLTKLQTLYLR